MSGHTKWSDIKHKARINTISVSPGECADLKNAAILIRGIQAGEVKLNHLAQIHLGSMVETLEDLVNRYWDAFEPEEDAA